METKTDIARRVARELNLPVKETTGERETKERYTENMKKFEGPRIDGVEITKGIYVHVVIQSKKGQKPSIVRAYERADSAKRYVARKNAKSNSEIYFYDKVPSFIGGIFSVLVKK